VTGSPRPRVLLVLHSAHDEGGMERAFGQLIRRAHREYDLVVISSELADDLARLVDWRRTRVVARPAPLRFFLFYVLAGLRLWRVRRAGDLVHTCGAVVPNRADLASVHFCHAGFRAAVGTPVDGGAPLLRRMNTGLAIALSLAAEWWSYGRGRTRTLAAVSQGVADELAQSYPGMPVVVTPNGVDLDRFRPDRRTRASIRRSHAVGDEEMVALFVGGDWHRKGLGIALEALVGAPDTILWIVGRGDVEAFRARAERLGIGGRVRFIGAQRDVERFYRTADVLVLPSRYEAFPLVSLEAAACGLPLLVTRVNGVTELIGDAEAGWILERSGEAFARALRVLAADPERRLRMGREARRRAEAFPWEASTASVLRLYRELLPEATVIEVVAA
jgi:glycosyltransferase involved in cell wall biosynthesis